MGHKEGEIQAGGKADDEERDFPDLSVNAPPAFPAPIQQRRRDDQGGNCIANEPIVEGSIPRICLSTRSMLLIVLLIQVIPDQPRHGLVVGIP